MKKDEVEYTLEQIQKDVAAHGKLHKMNQTDWGNALGIGRERFNRCLKGRQQFVFSELIELAEIMGKDGAYYIKNANPSVEVYRAIFGNRAEKWRKHAIRAIEENDLDIAETMLKAALEELKKTRK